jgi:Domain of unknown function DUF302
MLAKVRCYSRNRDQNERRHDEIGRDSCGLIEVGEPAVDKRSAQSEERRHRQGVIHQRRSGDWWSDALGNPPRCSLFLFFWLRTRLPSRKKKGSSKLRAHAVNETLNAHNHSQIQGVTLFALVDHSGEAGKMGLKMPPTELLIFGNPKAGTLLMLASPGAAIIFRQNSDR